MAKHISVVVPIYNEEAVLPHFFKRILPVLHDMDYELICVNDGSKDASELLIREKAKDNSRIKLISFYRNFGHQAALTAGYDFAKGDAVITIDADLQDPPELIHDMLALWEKGAKVVYAKRTKRNEDTFFKKLTADYFYRFINYLSDRPIPQQVGDYRLLDKEVVRFLRELPEHSRFLRGLVAWPGFPTEYVYFERKERVAGTTHYPFHKMVKLALDGIMSFSVKPLRIATYLGFVTGGIGFLGVLYAIIGKYVFASHWVTGWSALFAGIMFLGGVQLMCIGIIGEYLGRMYEELQGRPRYMVRELIGVERRV